MPLVPLLDGAQLRQSAVLRLTALPQQVVSAAQLGALARDGALELVARRLEARLRGRLVAQLRRQPLPPEALCVRRLLLQVELVLQLTDLPLELRHGSIAVAGGYRHTRRSLQRTQLLRQVLLRARAALELLTERRGDCPLLVEPVLQLIGTRGLLGHEVVHPLVKR